MRIPRQGSPGGRSDGKQSYQQKYQIGKELLKKSSIWAWDDIEEVISTKGKSRSGLCATLVESGGLKLAERWLYSPVSNLKEAAKKWFLSNIHMWSKFNWEIKNQIISDFFADGKYLPLPKKVESLRSIMAAAGDKVYLEKLDETISLRVKAYPVTSFQHPVYSPKNDEPKLIAKLMQITGRNGYLSSPLPLIFVSSEIPPILLTHPELEEEEDWMPKNLEQKKPKISIEELLGFYDPMLQQIIIYKRGIKCKWLRRQGFAEEWLSAVVLIHEIGHWITHQLLKPGVPTWPTDLYASSDIKVHEGWAQLITWWIADQVGGEFKHTFEELNKWQSPPYQVFKQFKGEPKDKVMASLEKLRLLQRPVRLEDWKNALEE